MDSQREIFTLQCLPCAESAKATGKLRKHMSYPNHTFFLSYWGQNSVKTLKDLTEVSGSNIVQIWTCSQHSLILFHLTLVFALELFLIYLWSFHHIPKNPRLNFHWWGLWAAHVPPLQFQAYLFLKGLNFQQNLNYAYCNHIPVLL